MTELIRTDSRGESVWRQTDPVLAAVLVKRLEAITKQMTNTLLRSGRSGVLNMARDFSCAIITPDNRLLLTAEGLPVHLIGIELLGESMFDLHPEFEPGDAFLHNSPYHGNTHHADFTVIVPVFYDGVHRFTTLARAHQADCGNSLPTTYMPLARDVYEEGALNFPCVRVQRGGRDIDDVIQMCRARIRVPDQWYGDYLGQIGAARIGERGLIELLDKYGSEAIQTFVEEWCAYGEARVEEVIRGLPKRRVAGEGHHDPVPGLDTGTSAGLPVRATIEIDPDVGRIAVDLSDNVGALPCGLNLSRATARNAAITGIMNALGGDLPHNAGTFSRIDVVIADGTLTGGAKHPTSMSMATTNVSDRLVNLVQSLMSRVSNDIGVAEGGVPMPPNWGVISGRDWRRGGSPFVNQIFLAMTGGPAAPGCDGWLNYGNAGCAGLLYRDSVELLEQRYPVYVERQGIVADTGGAGRWDGAPGSIVVYGPRQDPMTVAYAADGLLNRPRGVAGGDDGAAGTVWKERGDERTILPAWSAEVLVPSERIVSISTGGGGYGDPLERDPELVRWKAQEGWISIGRAREVYGVVLDEDFTLDRLATDRLRTELRALRP